MRLAPEVEQRKQAREADLLRENAARLRARGALLLDVGTTIDVLVVPQLPARLALPINAPTPQLGQGLMLVDVHAVVGRAFVLRFELGGFDQRPPSVEFLDPRTMAPLPFAHLPAIQEPTPTGQRSNLVINGHPKSQRPFLCVQGVREYHEHPQRDGDEWALYRGSVNVYAILDRVLRAIEQSHPTITVAVASWQIGVQ